MAEARTYTDRSGRTITRERALQAAADYILSDRDAARPIVEEAVEFMTDDELMEWLVYPDTGNFADEAVQ